MKASKSLLFVIPALAMLASCKHDVALETTVHEDGTLDKTITLQEKNTPRLFRVDGWERKSLPKQNKGDSTLLKKVGSKLTDDSVKIKKIDYAFSMSEDGKNISNNQGSISSEDSITVFTKTFASAEEANAQLAVVTDSTIAVTSHFEKKFRWFYTYIQYAETFHAVNRMEFKPDDYLTSEDYAFIDRLPAEGTKISRADSLYLSELTSKIFDVYGIRALFEAYWKINVDILTEYKPEQAWMDTLLRNKEKAFALMTDEDSKEILDDEYVFIDFMERLHIPLPYETIKRDYPNRIKPLEKMATFISHASDGNYTNRITMPWAIVNSNADSVAGNSLFWSPPSIKFLLKDYTMHAESRTLNWWAVIVSVLIVGFTSYLFVRKRN